MEVFASKVAASLPIEEQRVTDSFLTAACLEAALEVVSRGAIGSTRCLDYTGARAARLASNNPTASLKELLDAPSISVALRLCKTVRCNRCINRSQFDDSFLKELVFASTFKPGHFRCALFHGATVLHQPAAAVMFFPDHETTGLIYMYLPSGLQDHLPCMLTLTSTSAAQLHLKQYLLDSRDVQDASLFTMSIIRRGKPGGVASVTTTSAHSMFLADGHEPSPISTESPSVRQVRPEPYIPTTVQEQTPTNAVTLTSVEPSRPLRPQVSSADTVLPVPPPALATPTAAQYADLPRPHSQGGAPAVSIPVQVNQWLYPPLQPAGDSAPTSSSSRSRSPMVNDFSTAEQPVESDSDTPRARTPDVVVPARRSNRWEHTLQGSLQPSAGTRATETGNDDGAAAQATHEAASQHVVQSSRDLGSEQAAAGAAGTSRPSVFLTELASTGQWATQSLRRSQLDLGIRGASQWPSESDYPRHESKFLDAADHAADVDHYESKIAQLHTEADAEDHHDDDQDDADEQNEWQRTEDLDRSDEEGATLAPEQEPVVPSVRQRVPSGLHLGVDAGQPDDGQLLTAKSSWSSGVSTKSNGSSADRRFVEPYSPPAGGTPLTSSRRLGTAAAYSPPGSPSIVNTVPYPAPTASTPQSTNDSPPHSRSPSIDGMFRSSATALRPAVVSSSLTDGGRVIPVPALPTEDELQDGASSVPDRVPSDMMMPKPKAAPPSAAQIHVDMELASAKREIEARREQARREAIAKKQNIGRQAFQEMLRAANGDDALMSPPPPPPPHAPPAVVDTPERAPIPAQRGASASPFTSILGGLDPLGAIDVSPKTPQPTFGVPPSPAPLPPSALPATVPTPTAPQAPVSEPAPSDVYAAALAARQQHDDRLERLRQRKIAQLEARRTEQKRGAAFNEVPSYAQPAPAPAPAPALVGPVAVIAGVVVAAPIPAPTPAPASVGGRPVSASPYGMHGGGGAGFGVAAHPQISVPSGDGGGRGGPVAPTPRNAVKPLVSQASNVKRIQNALQHVLLAAPHLQAERYGALQVLQDYAGEHVVVLLTAESFVYKGLYAYTTGADSIDKLHGAGPKTITSDQVHMFYKYSTGSKTFQPMTTKHLSVSSDAVALPTRRAKPARPL